MSANDVSTGGNERRECSQPDCENDADGIYSNGIFVEPRCPDHVTRERQTVVREL